MLFPTSQPSMKLENMACSGLFPWCLLRMCPDIVFQKYVYKMEACLQFRSWKTSPWWRSWLHPNRSRSQSLQSWQPDSLQAYLVPAQCQHTRLLRWFCQGNVTIWPGVIRHFRFILLKYICRVGTDETSRNISFWPKAVAGDVSEVEWRQFIKAERLSAGVDYPISLFWKDLVKIYPNTKVGITITITELNSVVRLVWSGQ